MSEVISTGNFIIRGICKLPCACSTFRDCFCVSECHVGVNHPRRCHASHTDARYATRGQRCQTGKTTGFLLPVCKIVLPVMILQLLATFLCCLSLWPKGYHTLHIWRRPSNLVLNRINLCWSCGDNVFADLTNSFIACSIEKKWDLNKMMFQSCFRWLCQGSARSSLEVVQLWWSIIVCYLYLSCRSRVEH